MLNVDLGNNSTVFENMLMKCSNIKLVMVHACIINNELHSKVDGGFENCRHESMLVYFGWYCHTLFPQTYIERHGQVKSGKTGYYLGLHLSDMQLKEHFSTKRSGGYYYIFIHESYEPPSVPLFVNQGSWVDIQLRYTHVRNLPAPYSDCIDTEADNFVNPLKFYNRYTQTACEQECLINFYRSKCGCFPPHLGGVPHPRCSFLDRKDFSKCDQLSYYSSFKAVVKHCNCKHECEANIYSSSLSLSLTDNTLVPRASENRSITTISIGYDTLAYMSIEQQPAYPLGSVLAKIGGMLGLTLGASVLTLIELVGFLGGQGLRAWRRHREHRYMVTRQGDQLVVCTQKHNEKTGTPTGSRSTEI